MFCAVSSGESEVASSYENESGEAGGKNWSRVDFPLCIRCCGCCSSSQN